MADKNRGRPTWVRFSGIGIEFAGAVAGFTLVGYWIDRHYGTHPWGVLIGLCLGLLGGTYNLVRESLAATREQDRERRDRAARSDREEDARR